MNMGGKQAGRVPRVVLVDDDVAVLRALHRTLRVEPLEVLATTSVVQVIQWLRAEPVDLLVVDQRMPEMSGSELLELARDLSPRTWSVLLSAFPDAGKDLERRHVFVQRVLRKPWSDHELRTLVRTLAQCAASGLGAHESRSIDCSGLGEADVLELVTLILDVANSRGEAVSLKLVNFKQLRGSQVRFLKEFVELAEAGERPVALSDDAGCVPVFLRTLGGTAPRVVAHAEL